MVYRRCRDKVWKGWSEYYRATDLMDALKLEIQGLEQYSLFARDYAGKQASAIIREQLKTRGGVYAKRMNKKALYRLWVQHIERRYPWLALGDADRTASWTQAEEGN